MDTSTDKDKPVGGGMQRGPANRDKPGHHPATVQVSMQSLYNPTKY